MDRTHTPGPHGGKAALAARPLMPNGRSGIGVYAQDNTARLP